ncbi:MAG: phage tail sheath family protein, partial [Anaerolineae bacterium]
MPTYQTPGVYKEEVFLTPPAELLTGVPAFLGFTAQVPQDEGGDEKFNEPQMLTLWPQFEEYF